jgi:hypothetical protein
MLRLHFAFVILAEKCRRVKQEDERFVERTGTEFQRWYQKSATRARARCAVPPTSAEPHYRFDSAANKPNCRIVECLAGSFLVLPNTGARFVVARKASDPGGRPIML